MAIQEGTRRRAPGNSSVDLSRVGCAHHPQGIVVGTAHPTTDFLSPQRSTKSWDHAVLWHRRGRTRRDNRLTRRCSCRSRPLENDLFGAADRLWTRDDLVGGRGFVGRRRDRGIFRKRRWFDVVATGDRFVTHSRIPTSRRRRLVLVRIGRTGQSGDRRRWLLQFRRCAIDKLCFGGRFLLRHERLLWR